MLQAWVFPPLKRGMRTNLRQGWKGVLVAKLSEWAMEQAQPRFAAASPQPRHPHARQPPRGSHHVPGHSARHRRVTPLEEWRLCHARAARGSVCRVI